MCEIKIDRLETLRQSFNGKAKGENINDLLRFIYIFLNINYEIVEVGIAREIRYK